MMKRLLIIITTGLLAWGCTTVNQPITITDKNVIQPNGEKEDEYELQVLDPGFNTWFETTWSPAKDRSKQYYDTWNDRYVDAWNYKASSARYSYFFTEPINYDYNTDYGMNVDRKLFYYFQYVENELKIPILDGGGPKAVAGG